MVSILPVGGIECTWDRWQTLATGAKVSTKHDCGIFVLELTDVAGAEDVRALEGDDPSRRSSEGRTTTARPSRRQTLHHDLA
ncbi:MAG: hypothetical protein R3B99_04425 [Polyangiales bacterium]